jgi:phosphoribosylaminoimidazole carboxylase (NCAIR synthetase)
VKTILPGAVIGLLGGGENCVTLAQAAHRMGYRVHVFSRAPRQGAQPADVFVQAPYEDLDWVREFSAAADVIAVAAPDLPVLTVRAAESQRLVFPSAASLEKLEDGVGGKPESTGNPLAEFSILSARGGDGGFVSYPPVSVDEGDNTAQMPAPIRERTAKQAAAMARDAMGQLDFVGVASVSFVLTATHEIAIAGVVPFPRRFGFLTADGCVTSQFEQQIRAICGLPFGSTALLAATAMAELPAEVWNAGEPAWAAALALPNVKLSLTGVREGYLSATAASVTLAKQVVRAARAALTAK